MSPDVDYSAGVKQLIFTWAACLPPIGALVLSVIVGNAMRPQRPVSSPAPSDAGVLLGMVMLLHWYFTGAGVLSATVLTLRRVPASRKRSGWIAAILAVLASGFFVATNTW